MTACSTETNNFVQKKAETIRDVIRYIGKFKNATVVIYIDSRIIDSPYFSSHIRDISLIKQAGLKVILVPGAHQRIDSILTENKIKWQISSGIRITEGQSMPLIKSAAFEVADTVMTSLAGEKVTAVIGNWVRARGFGVINGIDYGTAGEIDRIDDEIINKILEDGFVPIFPCIGWSLNGKPYNISSMSLASQIAVHIKADKLFFLVPDVEINGENFILPENTGLSREGKIPAMNIQETETFIKLNEKNAALAEKENNPLKSTVLSILKMAKAACQKGVVRAHLLNGSITGTLPCEIFSDLGSGTMIYSSDYGRIRAMKREDVTQVLSVMTPFIQKGILLPRTEKDLEQTYNDYIVFEIDGAVRACAALHIYDKTQAEIAAVAVDETYSHIGIGPKLVGYLIEKAKAINLESLFILTTQTADWFESLGFKESVLETLPLERKAKWTKERSSKIYRLPLCEM